MSRKLINVILLVVFAMGCVNIPIQIVTASTSTRTQILIPQRVSENSYPSAPRPKESLLM
jgi:hypothetical protein